MNKNALNDAYQSFSQGGYNGSIDDFKQLIATNPNALNDSYETFKSGGYNGDINSFVTLMGVEGASTIKKKRFDPTNPLATILGESPSESGLSVLQGALDKALPNREKPKSFMSTIEDKITKDLAQEEQLNNTGFRKDLKDQEASELRGEGKSLSQVYDEYDDFFKTKGFESTGVKAWVEKTDRTDVTKKTDLFGNELSFDLGLGNVSNDTRYRVKDGFWERLVQGDSKYEKVTNASSINALNNRYNKDLSTDVAPIEVKPSVIDPFLSVNSDFLSKTEEDAQTVLEKKFGDDFIFEQTGRGTDYIKVTPKNGGEPMTFSFDEKSSDQAIRLQSFLRTNASFEKGSSSAEKIIKKNIITEKDNNYDNSSALQNNKYYESDEYKQLFKELSYFQKRDEIKRRQLENSVVEVSDMGLAGSIAESIFGEDEVQIKAKKEAKILNEKLYNSEEFKLYDTEKSKFEKQQEDRYSLLLDDYEIKKRSGDKEGARQAKLAIESGFSKDVIGDNLTHLSNSQYDVMNAKNDLNAKSARLQAQVSNGLITQEQYNIGVEALTVENKKLSVAAQSIVTNQKKMNALAGIYVAEKAKYGGFGSNLWNGFVVALDEVREPLSYIVPLLEKDPLKKESALQAKKAKIITPKQKKYYEDKGFSEQQIKNVFINNAKKEAIAKNKKAVIEGGGFDLTTEESKSQLNFVENALVGVAASLPSMLTRAIPFVGQGLAFASMANMSYNAIEEEMLSDPDFETTSEADRAVVAVPYAIVMGALENFALNRLSKGQAGLLGKVILSNAAKIIPKGASREVVERIINSEVKNIFAKGGLQVFRGTLAEFETGLYQAGLLDYGLKALYNELDPLDLKLTSEGGVTGGSLTGGELFATPDTKAGVAMAILEGGAAEAIGGFAMSTVMVGTQGLINGKISLYDQDDLKFFEDFSSDEEFKKLIVSRLKYNMLDGTMTKGEAQAALNDIDLVAGIFNSIDENLPQGAKLEAFNLINEKRRLEKEVEGKDPALSKKSNDRIAEINAKLEELPSKVQEMNLAYRGADIEDALKQGKGKSKTVRIDGKKISREDAQAELQTIITKLDENAIQKQTAGEVLVQPTTTVGEEVVQGEPTAEPQGLTEESQKRKEELELFLSEKNNKETITVGEIEIIRKAEQELEQLNKLAPVVVAPVTQEVVQGEPTTEPKVITEEGQKIKVEDIESKRIETEAKIKRKDLFSNGGSFSNTAGGSGVDSVPTGHSEINGIEFVQFSNPNTGEIDVVMTGKSDNDFVGFYRIYENGKATNKWSSKFENQSRNKEDFKTMIGGVQEMLPQGHEYTEKTSISTDGLRVWYQQLIRGYELQYDNKGKLITNKVNINGDSIVNDLGIAVNKGNFDNISVTNSSDMKKVKAALLPYLEKFGLNESNISFVNGTVEIDLPVLKKSGIKTETTTATQEVVSEEATPQTENLTLRERMSLEAKGGKNKTTRVPKAPKVEAPVVEVKAEPVVEPKVEPVVEPKAEPVKKPTVTAEDTMGVINSIKEDIEKTTNEIKETRAKARKAVNEIEAKILDTKNENQKEELQFDIVDIETQLEEDLEGLKDDLDRQLGMLKEEVGSLKESDIKKPENKNALVKYIDAAIKTLNGLNKLTYAKLDAGVTLGTLKLILQGIREIVIKTSDFNTAVREMAKKYKNEHDNKKITIDEFVKEINDYLDSTYVDPQTYKESLEKEIDKFAEIKNAVKQAQSQSRELRKKASNTIKDMLKGKFKSISAVHMKSIMTRLVNVKVENQTQYDKFLDYVDKVIEIADYDTKVREANVKRKNAKKNTVGNNPKLGDLSLDLLGSLSRMLNINPKLISKEVFDSYYNIVDDLSKRTTILSPGERTDLNEKVNEIVDSIEQNEEMLPDLKDAYDNYANKVVKNGVVDYAKTLTQMLEDGVINNNEFALMKKYKSKIVDAKVKVKMTPAEEAAEKAELINEITNTPMTLDAIVGDEFRLERELAKRLQVLLKQTDFQKLNNKDLKELLKIIDNINNGFVSNATQQMVEKLNSTKKSTPLATAVHANITSLYNKMKRFISKNFSRDEFGISVAPLNIIDEQLGDFETKNIYNSVFKDSGKAQQALEADISKNRAELIEIEKGLDKFFDKDHNKKVASKIKMMIYMLQIEKNSNPNSNKVHNAIDILDATIKFSKENSKKSKNSKADLELLESIRENFAKDDQIDMVKLFKSFGVQEKNALKKLQEINNSMTKKAAYTATVINGDKITTFDNYMFHNIINASDDISVDDLVNNISNNMQPTTKSKNLEERDGKVRPMNLNPFLAVTISARSVLLNYHLTEPIRTARKTLIAATKILDADKASTQEQYDILNAIKEAYETATKDLLTSNFTDSSELAEWFAKQGYRAVLASSPRALAELVSNASFVLSAFPKEIYIGFNSSFSLSNSSDAKNILSVLGSSLISRIYPEHSLSSIFIDSTAFTSRISRDAKIKPKLINGVWKIYDKSSGKYVDFIALVADNTIAQPDKIIMRPLWFGSFINAFKNKTGVEPDFNKIKENDEAYMDEYRDALEEARDVADNNADLTGGNMNPYMSSLQNVIRKEDGIPIKVLKAFNKYMNKFTVKEYYTARKGFRALVKDGDITQKQGALILTGVALRMTLYTTITRLMSELIMYSLGFGDDDDDDDDSNVEHIGRKLYQGFTSMLTTLIFGRRFGNVVRMAENYFIEWANEIYGEDIGLRNGEYDPYEDAIQFNQLQDGKIDKTTDLVKVIAGPYAPAINFGDLAYKKVKELSAPEAATERARITRAKEWGRLGLEAGGLAGGIPFYKDVRKIFIAYTYKELKKELKEDAAKKVITDAEKANTLETETNMLNRMRVIHKDERSRSIIDDELRKLSDPKYRKEENKKEEDEQKRLAKKYGYESMTEFEYDDKKKYDKVFGDDSPYRKRMAPTAKIRQELDARILADKFNKPYKTKEEKKEEKKEQARREKRSTAGGGSAGSGNASGGSAGDGFSSGGSAGDGFSSN